MLSINRASVGSFVHTILDPIPLWFRRSTNAKNVKPNRLFQNRVPIAIARPPRKLIESLSRLLDLPVLNRRLATM
jgi:hypothetical protein